MMTEVSRLIESPSGTSAFHGGGQWAILGTSPSRLGEVVPADVNDPWYPPAPEVLQALALSLSNVQHTPETTARTLTGAVAEKLGVDRESLILAAGSSPILHDLIAAVCGPGRPLLVPAPTYSEYERVAGLSGAAAFRWLLDEERSFAIDLRELASAAVQCSAGLVAFANPNNPTGQTLPADALRELSRALPEDCLLLVDEAYIDQAPEHSLLHGAADLPNTAVVRSLSKGAALAGARLGYAVLGERWKAAVTWEKPPWSINLFAQAAALPALDNSAYVLERTQETRRLRRELFRELASMPGLTPVATSTHYFLVRLDEPWPRSTALVRNLRQEKVLVRDCAPYGEPLGDRFVRVTSRSPQDNARILQAFRHLLPYGEPD